MRDLQTDDSESMKMAALDTDRMSQRNLDRALLDFELANARVLDLTQRLTAMSTELIATRQQLEEARMRIGHVEADKARVEEARLWAEHEIATIKGSLAYRTFRVLGDSRARLR